MLEIRAATEDDFHAIWTIFHAVVRAGDTYPFSPETTRDEAHQIWMAAPAATYVAVTEDRVVGTYYIKPNQACLGAHVCNAGYMVAPEIHGRGIGRAMCEHSLVEARRMGFTAMQYNFVVATNERAVRLWQDMGFEIVGTVPDAFKHARLGLVPAHIMYRSLDR